MVVLLGLTAVIACFLLFRWVFGRVIRMRGTAEWTYSDGNAAVVAAGAAGLVGDAVLVGVELAVDGAVDVAGVQVDPAVAVPVVELALERADDEHVGQVADLGVVQGGQHAVARGEYLVQALADDGLDRGVAPT